MDTVFFTFVEAGTFLMGSAPEDSIRNNAEVPQHKVSIGPFYIGRFQITQKEYELFILSHASHFTGNTLPVEIVSWYDAVEYCNYRSLQEKLNPVYGINKQTKDPRNLNSGDPLKWTITWDPAADGYRLPTEAEWEYAAKAGNYVYAGSNDIDEVCWYGENSRGKSHPVGKKSSNPLGIFDMSGNVWEWCWDWYGPYSPEEQTNPTGPAAGSLRVIRGGSWGFSAIHARTVDRYHAGPTDCSPHLGFRLARSAG
ncbi:MAG: formylglycine-generating enzyme family protein [Spirochaetaceae bacterium]|jgi:formylglycine-generating enzyme required for sulfatase activity|nr:formylglycine-generating enzyme family protein [Spirochaetaceae bacterium]